VTTTAAPGRPLSAELRARTADAHGDAEASPVLTALAQGRVDRSTWAALVARLLPVYAALERTGEALRDDPVVAPFLVPGLERTARLTADLEHLAAPAPLTPAAVAYAARVEQAGRTSGVAFLAHHYTRYLGDLSGGQVIRAALERSLGLADGAGLSALCFPDLRAGEVKRRYREQLDALALTPAQREELVAEALVAYRHNTALAAELDGTVTT
jgi:heme oxygenase (biliverdin-producing, ferredoxin)